MKRGFIISLIICILCCGIAHSEHDGSILFRDIPWGETIDYVENILNHDGFEIRSSEETDSAKGFNYSSLSNIMFIKSSLTEKYGNYVYFKNFSPVKVAGYDVYATYGYFAYLPNDNKIITKERELTSFMLACYEIVPVDIDYASEDLINKLTSLYGEYDKSGVTNSTFKYTYYVWYSSTDDTFLCFIRLDSTNIVKSRMYIYYGTFEGDKQINTARELQEEYAKKTEIENSQSSGTDGL